MVPAALRGLNWGAFWLNWIWGLGNRTPLALLCFVPLLGAFMPWVLLFKGNEWAWRNKQWESVEAFQTTQRRWGFAVLWIFLGILLVAVVDYYF